MKLLRKINAVVDGTNNVLAVLASSIIIFIMLAVSMEVFMRYFFSRPSKWVVEVSEISLLYITFLGTAWLLARGGHVKIDLLFSRLNPRNQAVVSIITSILGAIICLLVTWYSGLTTWDQFQRGIFNPSFLDIPNAPILVIIPIGSFLLSIQFLRSIYRVLSGREAPPKKEQGLIL